MIFMTDGAKAINSLVMRSPMPGNMVVPPDRTASNWMLSMVTFKAPTAIRMLISWSPSRRLC